MYHVSCFLPETYVIVQEGRATGILRDPAIRTSFILFADVAEFPVVWCSNGPVRFGNSLLWQTHDHDLCGKPTCTISANWGLVTPRCSISTKPAL